MTDGKSNNLPAIYLHVKQKLFVSDGSKKIVGQVIPNKMI